jgi:hypothetical protein
MVSKLLCLNIAIFFSAGCILLLLLTSIVYKTGLVHKTRDTAGHLKKRQSATGIIMVIVFLLIISFFVLFQLLSFNSNSSFLEILLWTFALMILLVLFDSFFIDLLLIGKIRPSFLDIPEETTFDTMKIHVRKTFSIGWIFIIPVVLTSTLIAYLLMK